MAQQPTYGGSHAGFTTGGSWYREPRTDFGLARNWWALVLRGVLAIAFGILAFWWPTVVWLFVVLTFAIYALLDGIFAIAAAIVGHGRAGQRWALLIEGLLGMAAGVIALVWPAITELALLFIIGGWAIATGVFELVAAVRIHGDAMGRVALGVGGVLSIVLGLALVFVPLAGLLVVAWWIGAYAIIFGVLLLVMGFRMREWGRGGRAMGA